MKVLLLANQPERTTRLILYGKALRRLGYEVIIPRFGTRNWLSISKQTKELVELEKPDILHIFNVPDIIYPPLLKLKGKAFRKLIYDYRSPWGLELQESFGLPGKVFGEIYERKMARGADLITTVNAPLGEKVRSYLSEEKRICVVPNYPERSFSKDKPTSSKGEAIVFIGRVCNQEGIGKLLQVAKAIPGEEFWIVGGGPFAWWSLLRKPDNVKALGWQPHEKVADLVSRAKLCLIPREETVITPYSTDRSIWKLNEYLNLGKRVVASGITKEEERKNLVVVPSSKLTEAVSDYLDKDPMPMKEEDFRYWDRNDRIIKEVYETV